MIADKVIYGCIGGVILRPHRYKSAQVLHLTGLKSAQVLHLTGLNTSQDLYLTGINTSQVCYFSLPSSVFSTRAANSTTRYLLTALTETDQVNATGDEEGSQDFRPAKGFI